MLCVVDPGRPSDCPRASKPSAIGDFELSAGDVKEGAALGGDSGKPDRLDAAAIAAKFAALKSSPKGLTSDEARARLAKDGPNAIVAKEEPLWHKLIGYFWGPIPWMIEAAGDHFAAAGRLAGLRRRHRPAAFTMPRWVSGRTPRRRARSRRCGRALALKRAGAARRAMWRSLDAADLVVGDVVDVAAGAIVPADLLLTGRRLPVDRSGRADRRIPAGRQGGRRRGLFGFDRQAGRRCRAWSPPIGNATFFGRTAKLVASAGADVALAEGRGADRRLSAFSSPAGLAVVLVGVQVLSDAWSSPGHLELGSGRPDRPVRVGAAGRLGAGRVARGDVGHASRSARYALSKQKAIVSRLSAIEELAGVDILCSDKTGTLTQNKLTLSERDPLRREPARKRS